MNPIIRKFLVPETLSVRDVLQVINANAQGVAFVVDGDGRLCGVATDGDIRRGLLGSHDLDAPVGRVMTADYLSLPYGTNAETILSHLRGRIRIIPLVDDEGRPVDVASLFHHRMLPVAEPWLAGNELEYVVECLKTNWISSRGRFVSRFEQEFADFTGAAHTVAVNSGTAALHLSLMALGVGPGDEVIVPDLTFAASAAAVVHAGATPVLVDVSSDTWCLDPDAAEAAVTPNTRAIMPVHLYGQPADMDALMDLAERRGLLVVEDAAEALGAYHRERHVGTIGDAGVFSFYGNKLITTGEGGMIVFKEAAAAEHARRLRNHGMDPDRRYWHPEVGYNYRLTNVQAAIGVGQLERIGELIARKREIGASYRAELEDLPFLTVPAERACVANIYWTFSVLIDENAIGIDRAEFINRLALNGIETRPLFYPLHTMPPYREFARNRLFDISIALSERGVSLPSAVNLKPEEIRHVSNTIKHIRDTRNLMRQFE